MPDLTPVDRRTGTCARLIEQLGIAVATLVAIVFIGMYLATGTLRIWFKGLFTDEVRLASPN